jgi:uracil phosphoribosyltransferase
MKLVNLGESNSLLNSFVAQIRDKTIQKDSLRFRTNLHRLGQVFAYEISKTLAYSVKDVETPLGTAQVSTYDTQLVISTILRAGLPLHDGILSYFEDAGNAFIAAYRKYETGEKFHINTEYCNTPDLAGKTLIIADTMMATGASMILAYERMIDEGGEPDYTHLVCPITSVYAVEALKKELPANTTLWTAGIDEELTSHSFIVPGLGDAGDLAYGEKI